MTIDNFMWLAIRGGYLPEGIQPSLRPTMTEAKAKDVVLPTSHP